MSKISDYRATLCGSDDWETFLLAESGLPGPRANLELVQAVADEGSLDQFRRWLARDEEYLALNIPHVHAAGHLRPPPCMVPYSVLTDSEMRRANL